LLEKSDWGGLTRRAQKDQANCCLPPPDKIFSHLIYPVEHFDFVEALLHQQ
jgi:hypothetical protein